MKVKNYMCEFDEPKSKDVEPKVRREYPGTPEGMNQHNEEFDEAAKDYSHRKAWVVEDK